MRPRSRCSHLLLLGLLALSAACGGGGSAASVDPGSTVTAFSQFGYVGSFFNGTVGIVRMDEASGELRQEGFVPVASGVMDVLVEPQQEHLYVAAQGTPAVHGFRIDPSDGQLEPLAGSPFDAGVAPTALCTDPEGRFLYVAHSFSFEVRGYRIDRDADTLVELPGSPFPVDGVASTLTASSDGRHLYVMADGSAPIAGFAIDQETGALDPFAASPSGTGANVFDLVFNASGTRAYGTQQATGTLVAYQRDLGTGALTEVGSVATEGGPTNLALSPDGRFVYVVNSVGKSVSAYRVGSSGGAPQLVEHEPSLVGEVFGIEIDAGGQRLYVASRSSSRLLTLGIDGATGALERESEVRTQRQPSRLAFTSGDAPIAPRPHVVVIASSGSRDLVSLLFDPASGMLTEAPGSPLQFTGKAVPTSIAGDPRGEFVFVAGVDGPNRIAVVEIDRENGAPSLVPGEAVEVQDEVISIAMDRSGRFLYATTTVGLRTLRFDRETRTLSETVELVEAGAAPEQLVTDPVGSFVLVTDGDQLVTMTTDPVSGAPNLAYVSETHADASEVTGLALTPTGFGALAVTTEPDFAELYWLVPGDIEFELSYEPNPQLFSSPRAATFDPSGRFAYVTQGVLEILQRGIDTQTFEFRPIGPDQEVTTPMDQIVSARGAEQSYVYATGDSGQLDAFSIDPASGLLSPLEVGLPSQVGVAPIGMVVLERYD